MQALIKLTFLPGPWFEGAGTIKKTSHRYDPFGPVCGRVNKLITNSGLLVADRTLRAPESAGSENLRNRGEGNLNIVAAREFKILESRLRGR